ncbi:11404_t:CDS:1 [Paraglomus brasilianum]|uniref:11404_t:CDS:1 n=1 Tax=Paraglomus brasilianum TaxID=144538 RepID=A0A9N9CJE1_9GLOM|nr:11404_t:CDS:1 [Paraglomus brasilianum]
MSADDSNDSGQNTRTLTPTMASANTSDFLTGRNNESESEHQSALPYNDVQSRDKVNKRNKSFSNPDDEKKSLKKQIKQLQATIQNLNASMQNNSSLLSEKDIGLHKLMALNTELEKYNTSLRERVESLEKQVDTLAKQKEEFKEEASRYQSALGDATSLTFKEDDPNNPIFLKRYIQVLEKKLDNLARTKGAMITVNSSESTKLVNRYLHPYKMQEDADKVLIKAALQRMVTEKTLKKTAVAHKKAILPKGSTPNKETSTLEFGIAQATETLCTMIAQFISDNKISDNIADLVPAKIRQQIYSLLGTHAFTDANHPFIQELSVEVLNILDKYRTNEKDTREKQLSQINDTIRALIRVLYFRPKVFGNAKIEFVQSGIEFDDALMRGAQLDEDDSEESVLVALCALPMVYKEQNKEGNIIYGRAKVSLRKKNDERFEMKAGDEVEEVDSDDNKEEEVSGSDGDSRHEVKGGLKSELGDSYVNVQEEPGNHMQSKNGTQDSSAIQSEIEPNVQTTNGALGTTTTKRPRSASEEDLYETSSMSILLRSSFRAVVSLFVRVCIGMLKLLCSDASHRFLRQIIHQRLG